MSLLSSLSQNPIQWTIRVIALCLLTQVLMTPNLWQCQERFFPLLPMVADWPLAFLCALDRWLYYLIILGLVGLIGKPHSKILLSTLLLLLGILLLQDLNRLQVWLFQLAGMLLIALAYQKDRPEWTLFQWQWVLIAVYFWGAVQKFNVYFLRDTVPWIFEDFGIASWFEDAPFWAYGFACIELMMAFGLWLSKTRRWTVGWAILFHLMLLLLLGPLGKNWNPIVWPWNLAQIALLILLFYRQKSPIHLAVFKLPFKRQWVALAVTALLVVGPQMSFLGDWPEPLSFKMYAGIHPEAVLYWEEKTPACIPNSIEDLINEIPKSADTPRRYVLLDQWAIRELGVPPFASQYRLKQIGAKFCECLEYPEIGGMDILVVDRWRLDKEEMSKYSCKELLKSN